MNTEDQNENDKKETTQTPNKENIPFKDGAIGDKKVIVLNPEKKKPVSFFKIQLFQARCWDYFIIILGIFASFGVGVSQPIFAWLYGSLINYIGRLQTNPVLINSVHDLVLKLYMFAICIFVAGFAMMAIWIYNGRVTSERIRTHYFRVILQQEQAWFDSNVPYEYSTKVQGQITKIDNGLGEKVGNIFANIAQAVTGYIIAFLTSWKLSLVIFSLLPLFLLGGFLIGRATQKGMIKSRIMYEKAGGIAEEVLYNIKTVASFTNFEYEKRRFGEKIEETYKASKDASFKAAIGIAVFFFAFYMNFALALGYGSLIIANRELNDNTHRLFYSGDVMTVLLAMMFGAAAFGSSAPIIRAVMETRHAAVEFFELMKRKPQIDASKSILKPNKETIIGNITFQNVVFTYPTAKDREPLFKNLNLMIPAYKKTAIVGHSGCGKSTILSLILRLYDIQGGHIFLDQFDLQTLDIMYLRSLIGYVPQEPVLFNISIRDNIIFGRDRITEEQVKEACRKAYAEDFINSNKLGLDYIVGTKGSKLSGGQKQRIAIARAILTKPKILILDEATSALDNKSEKEVQRALNIVSQGITTIIVAHRLSTIRNADNIIVLSKGTIIEQGNHQSLIENRSHYYNLVKNEIVMEDAKEDVEVVEQVVQQAEAQTLIEPLVKKIIEEEEDKDKPEKIEKLIDKKYKLFNVMMENKAVVFVGTFFACCAGCSWVIHASILGDAIAFFFSDDSYFVKSEGFYTAMKYLGFGFGMGIIIFMQNYLFSLQGDFLAKRYRFLVYERFLKLDMSYYDIPTHSPGVLLSKLSNDSTQINGVALGMFGVTIEIIVSSVIGIAVSIAYSWKIGLINLAIFPILLYLSGMQWKMRSGTMTTKDLNLENQAANILSESITNTKTIFSYNVQDKIADKYYNLLKHRQKAIVKQGIVNGLLFGAFQFVLFADYATLLLVGAHFMVDPPDPRDRLQVGAFFKSMLVSVLTSFGLGNAQQYLGDISKGKESLKSLYEVLKEPFTIYQDDTTNKVPADNITGRIEFRNVTFAYPTVPQFIVLEQFNITIEPGQKVAFVGHSGCGKSSIIQLIERFYDITAGEILIDGINIKDYNLISYRQKVSLVMQEPAIFKATNLDNVKYGKLDSDDNFVYQIADEVQIGQFVRENNINSIPSGGEKQRLAIARALVRDPKILLLDEATSALDNEREKLVQAGLDRLMAGRTMIAVAHRLTTIEHYDVIYVMDKGKIIEFGNHEQLYSMGGVYHRLYNLSKRH
jgi:ATP-binding cassette subfamily B (MDR/TAP) protein 1